MSHSYVICDLFLCDFPIHMWRDAFVRHFTHDGTHCDIRMSDITYELEIDLKNESFVCHMWLILMWLSHVIWLIHTWHDSFTRDMTHLPVTWLIYPWHDSLTLDMTHSHVTWLIHTWHDSFTRDMTHSHVTWLIHMRSYEVATVSRID